MAESPAGITVQVDPRVGWEGEVVWAADPSSVGRSPRVRGRLLGQNPVRTYAGSIPACAGKASALSAAIAASRVDPRVCGEGDCSPSRAEHPPGRSPRVRGRPYPKAASDLL